MTAGSHKLNIFSSVKKGLMPHLASLLSSQGLLTTKRLYHEFKRSILARPHTLELYLKLTDPYSYLLLQVLAPLVKNKELNLRILLVDKLDADMFPEPELWQKNALRDAQYLADLYQLDYQPEAALLADAQQLGLYQSQILATQELDAVLELFRGFWGGEYLDSEAGNRAESELLQQNASRLKQKGHYQSAMIFYAGEWYWGIDRLWYLQQRLSQLGVLKKMDFADRQFALMSAEPLANDNKQKLVMYFSMRSPYSFLGLEQALLFSRNQGLELELRPVLPMLMRGLKVPDSKKMYIFHDTKREATRLGVNYGKVADPLGLAVEYCYALYEYALEQGKGTEFMLQFARAVNSQGVYADNEQGLKLIVERVGLNWEKAKPYMHNNQWHQRVEDNLQQLSKLGLWGVPCFQYQQTTVWGQDRLWVIKQKCMDKEY